MTTDSEEKPTIDENSVIGRDAEWLFEGFFRGKKWAARKEIPDRFLDFTVEPDESGEPSGQRFGVQVKGKIERDPNEGVVCRSFKTKHLKYYLRKCRFPVFVFRIDTTTGKGYWLFAQQYIRENIGKKLEKQKTVTLHFDEQNNTDEFARFQEALATAHKYVEELHPGSIAAAVRRRQDEIRARDSRFDVAITVEKGVVKHYLTPKEPVSLNLKIRGTQKDHENLWERGLPTTFKAGQVEISGSPLFEKIGKNPEADFTLHFGREEAGSIRLCAASDSQPFIVDVGGRFRCGARYATFVTGEAQSPFQLSLTLSVEGVLAGHSFSMETDFHFETWQGQRVLSLPYFDKTRDAVNALSSPKDVRIEIFVRGNSLGTAKMNGALTPELQHLRGVVEWLEKCRYVAIALNVNPVLLPISEITDGQWQLVEFLYGLLKSGQFREPIPNASISFDVDKRQTERKTDVGPGSEMMIVQRDPQIYSFLGVSVPVGPLKWTFTQMRLVETIPTTDGSNVKFQGEESSMQVVSFAKPGEFDPSLAGTA